MKFLCWLFGHLPHELTDGRTACRRCGAGHNLLDGSWHARQPVPKREECREYICEAWAWTPCSDGRCKYHCNLYCKCAPRGEESWKPDVIKGGRS